MRIKGTQFDDDRTPREFHVVMSLDEMALLYRLAGHIAPKRISQLSGDHRWGNALADLAEGSGEILAMYFDDGANDVIPRFRIVSEEEK